jgi:oxygen-dependent protoporphyrinogen oxidase
LLAPLAPEAAAALRAILGGAFDPESVERDDTEIAAQAVGDLGRAAGLRRDPDFTAVWRHPAGIPQYDLGHAARVRAVDGAIGRLPGLHVIGYALRGVGINDCIKAASALAHSLDQGVN